MGSALNIMRKTLKLFYFSLLSTCFSLNTNAAGKAPLEMFTYCSNGSCRLITGEFFHNNRGMPVDLNVTCKKNKQYALTFDDGPSANYPRLLEILKKHNVKATFFVVGANVVNPDAAKWFAQAYSEGHFMANHTLNHADLTGLTDDQVLEQVKKSRELMLKAVFPADSTTENAAALRFSTTFVRPPFGNIDSRVNTLLKEQGFTSVRWNADRYDWQLPGNDPKTPEIIVKRVLQQLDFIDAADKMEFVFNHSILDLNHDWQNTTLDALNTWIPLVQQRGYKFVTMDECLQPSEE